MAPQREVERLLRDIDKVIANYSNSQDQEVQRIIRSLKRRRKKFDATGGLDTAFKILVIADKLRQWLDRVP